MRIRIRAAVAALGRCCWTCNNCGTPNYPDSPLCQNCARRG